MGSSKNSRTQKAFEAHASKALRQLVELDALIEPDADLQPRDRKHANAMQRISLPAMETAIRIAESQKGRFPEFDLGEARDAVSYERVMSAVSQSAKALASRIDTSILKRRHVTASSTLALYAALKGTARLRGDLYTDVAMLGDLVAPHRVRRRKAANPSPAQQQPAAPASVQPAKAGSAPAVAPDAAGSVTPAPVVH
jgi:hypothetical protein